MSEPTVEPATIRVWERWISQGLMIAAVLAWLWPVGLGGQMPVGGDETQFSIGLMDVLKNAIQAGKLPLWNDLWGFGFPGIAESQMGVYYPPHLLLYSIFSTETAYLASLVLHTLWAALGAAWAARRFGASEVAASLAGFVWATSGFFLIHLPHQWGYTVGSWMPWAWGLGWQIARGAGNRRTPWLLAAVLALQVLPGHFQLAFITEVGVVVLTLVGAGRSVGRRIVLILALAAMLPLASMQLWPTYQLARLSDSHRDFEYLSGFAATPLHLINYITPGLFHRSPLWRPVVWDTLHTSPEELLGWVGLIPLFLAVGAITRGFKHDPAVRTLTVLGLVSLCFSFGPYVPGFSTLIQLPGFSFFRAPARWTLATNLALAILAARGFDALPTWPRSGRAVRWFLVVSLGLVSLVVLGFELALTSAKNDQSFLASTFDQSIKLLPWADRPESKPFRAVMAEVSRPQFDGRVQTALARLDGKMPRPPGPTLAGERFSIYALELGDSGLLFVGFLVVSLISGRPKIFASGLILLTLGEGLIQTRYRPYDLGPCRSLVAQSPVLSRLSREPRGSRTLDPARNLFMIAGVDPISAYRTLDLPTPSGLIPLAHGGAGEARAVETRKIAGVGLRVSDPIETRILMGQPRDPKLAPPEIVTDPTLAGWLLGADLARLADLKDFAIITTPNLPARAWVLPSNGLEEVEPGIRFSWLEKFRSAVPLPYRSAGPEDSEVDVRVADPVASMVVLSKTYDPEWQARWTGESGETRPAKVVKVLGGWQGVATPGPGRWTLHLDYPGRAVRNGLAVGSTAWSFWLMGFFWACKSKSLRRILTIETKTESPL